LWSGVVVLFAIPAMTFSTKYNCWEPSGDGWWAHMVV